MTATAAVSRSRGVARRVFLVLLAIVLFAGFCSLGVWQVQRRAWKLDLIERVEQRAHAEPVGADFDNPFSSRVHYIVLNSGEAQLKTWQSHQRNISADFLKAFGNETNVVPPVTAIIVGADSDNTLGSSLGYVADIVVQP